MKSSLDEHDKFRVHETMIKKKTHVPARSSTVPIFFFSKIINAREKKNEKIN